MVKYLVVTVKAMSSWKPSPPPQNTSPFTHCLVFKPQPPLIKSWTTNARLLILRKLHVFGVCCLKADQWTVIHFLLSSEMDIYWDWWFHWTHGCFLLLVFLSTERPLSINILCFSQLCSVLPVFDQNSGLLYFTFLSSTGGLVSVIPVRVHGSHSQIASLADSSQPDIQSCVLFFKYLHGPVLARKCSPLPRGPCICWLVQHEWALGQPSGWSHHAGPVCTSWILH